MRIEATVPDARGAAVTELAEELGLTKSQLVDEALALFVKVTMEARQGRRLVTVGGAGDAPCEIVTPSLAHLEWTSRREALALSSHAVEQLVRLVLEPPAPNTALLAALADEAG